MVDHLIRKSYISNRSRESSFPLYDSAIIERMTLDLKKLWPTNRLANHQYNSPSDECYTL